MTSRDGSERGDKSFIWSLRTRQTYQNMLSLKLTKIFSSRRISKTKIERLKIEAKLIRLCKCFIII